MIGLCWTEINVLINLFFCLLSIRLDVFLSGLYLKHQREKKLKRSWNEILDYFRQSYREEILAYVYGSKINYIFVFEYV